MILHQNYEITLSVFQYFIVKILCELVEKYRLSMYNRQPTLTSIPEQVEKEEITKWVPKKKHEVLKAKYKCLKKLFQIYDASVIGILPQNYTIEEPVENVHRRRSRRTKTDACAGTAEDGNGDAVLNELQLNIDSSSQIDRSKTSLSNSRDDKSTQDSKEDVSIGDSSDHHVPYLQLKSKRRPTRFQIFLQRILGIKQEKNYGSDININRRRRNGLQFRRLRRARRSASNVDVEFKDVRSPAILSYVQSVQRNYLMDTTPRHCPMVGCEMISYGIINYNDHLNLCHFPDRKYICHYCHEGFTNESDKMQHENEHIGMNKATPRVINTLSAERFSTKIASNTQTEPPKVEVPEEKLKKIVSFFDKIANPVTCADMRRNSSETLRTCQCQTKSDDSDTTKSENSSQLKTAKRINSLLQERHGSKTSSETNFSAKCSPIRCQLCGESFEHRRQLSLHVDLEHRANDKISKFHSCAGILNHKLKSTARIVDHSQSFVSSTDNKTSKSDNDNLSYDPSTNIVYYTSVDSIDKTPSKLQKDVQKVPTGFCYKWEPCQSVIRV